MIEKAQIKAKVTFLTAEEGGRRSAPMSGVRPQLKVGDQLTSCVVWSAIPEQLFELGKEYEVGLELMFWEQCKDLVSTEMPIQLNEGGRIVGKGKALAIVPPAV
ncbi:MAG TPA: hypothetical protein VMH87_03520 [Pseudomonadales bacterium]|nr:hypothetical protein [Pseudomonadales bacterium]